MICIYIYGFCFLASCLKGLVHIKVGYFVSLDGHDRIRQQSVSNTHSRNIRLSYRISVVYYLLLLHTRVHRKCMSENRNGQTRVVKIFFFGPWPVVPSPWHGRPGGKGRKRTSCPFRNPWPERYPGITDSPRPSPSISELVRLCAHRDRVTIRLTRINMGSLQGTERLL